MSQTPPPCADLDPALLQRAQAGDEPAFGNIMRLYYETVFRLVYSIVRNEHDARDVCQDVWLTIWKQLAGFRRESKFSTWLHSIAVRRAVDHLRKRRRWYDRFLPFSTGDDTVESVPEPTSSQNARTDAEQSERAAALGRAIDALPLKLRTVLALREVQELSYEEIARTTGIPTGTVMSRLYHARRLLAQKLKDPS